MNCKNPNRRYFYAILCIFLTTLSCNNIITPIVSDPQTATIEHIENLVTRGSALVETHPDSAKAYFEEAIVHVTKQFNENKSDTINLLPLLKQLALAHRGLCLYFTNIGELQSALSEIDIAITSANKLNKLNQSIGSEVLTSIMISKGVILKKFGRFTEAVETYHKAIEIAESNNDSASIAIFYTNTGNIYQEIGETEKALEYITKAIELHKKTNNKRGVAFSSITLANILNNQKKLEEALPHYHYALNYFKEIGHPGGIGLINSNLGVLEKKLKNHNKALEHFRVALINLKKVNNNQGLALVYGNLADLHIEKKEYNKAIEYAIMQLDIAKQSQALVNQLYGYKYLSEANAGKGNYKEAYENHRNYRVIHDSIVSIDNRKEIARLEAVYQDEQKKKEIEYLGNLTNALENKNQIKNTFLITLSLLLFVAVLLASIWIRYTKLSAQRKQLNLEHKLLRSQMNPHFLFNSLSAIQNMILRSQKMQAAGLVAEFSKFIRFILDSSRSSFVPLSQEIEAIKVYIELQKVRFPNLFTHEFTFEFEENEKDEILVPPLIIQPFVENSIIHGFPKDTNSGKLQIHLFKQSNNLFCRVKDNGIGISKTEQTQTKKHKSVATQITRERILLLNKRLNCNASLTYEDVSKNGEGTSVLIKLPLLNTNEELKFNM